MQTEIGRKLSLCVMISGASLSLVACGGGGNGVEGTYTDAAGATKIEFKAGGQAVLTILNEPGNCSYKVDQKTKITIDCGANAGGPVVMTLSDDGRSLAGPPGGFLPTLKK